MATIISPQCVPIQAGRGSPPAHDPASPFCYTADDEPEHLELDAVPHAPRWPIARTPKRVSSLPKKSVKPIGDNLTGRDSQYLPATESDLTAPSEARIQAFGASWCDLLWKPVSDAISYVVFIRSDKIGGQRAHYLRYHLDIPGDEDASACQFRVSEMLPSRKYEIHVAAGDRVKSVGPLSQMVRCNTTSHNANEPKAHAESVCPMPQADEPVDEVPIMVYGDIECNMILSKRNNKRRAHEAKLADPLLDEIESGLPVVPCVVVSTVMVPRAGRGVVTRLAWNQQKAQTHQCHYPACGQLFKVSGNKTRHERTCKRDVCEANTDEHGNLKGFTLKCRWKDCQFRVEMPVVQPGSSYDIQSNIPEAFMRHIESHMPPITTKTARSEQVWCQWRGCGKVPMYAQSLHRHVKESHLGAGNRYNTGQGGLPIQTSCPPVALVPPGDIGPLTMAPVLMPVTMAPVVLPQSVAMAPVETPYAVPQPSIALVARQLLPQNLVPELMVPPMNTEPDIAIEATEQPDQCDGQVGNPVMWPGADENSPGNFGIHANGMMQFHPLLDPSLLFSAQFQLQTPSSGLCSRR